MRYILLLVMGLAAVCGCSSSKGMKVDNPVVGPPPPRILQPEATAAGSESELASADEGAKGAGEPEKVVNTSGTLEEDDEPRDYPDDLVVATVNDAPIFAGTLIEPYRGRLEKARSQHPFTDDQYKEFCRKQKEMIVKGFLPEAVNRKILVLGLNALLKPEQQKLLKKHLDDSWGKEMRTRMDAANVTSIREYDEYLQKEGRTLDGEKQDFCDKEMAGNYVQIKGHLNYEPSRGDLLEYYRAHAADYDYKTEVHWRQIVISDSVRGGEQQAKIALNQAISELLDGDDFAKVAIKYSDGPTAKDGGLRDWERVDGLKNKEVKTALLELPVGDVSPVIRFENTFQIVMIVDRKDAGRIPFTDVQDAIKGVLKREKQMERAREAIEKLRSEAIVKTIFDDEQGGNAAPSQNESNAR